MTTSGGTGPMMQSVGVIAELPALIREMGGSPAAVFAHSDLDPAVLTPDTRLPFHSLVTLLDVAARETGCPHLGLLLGQRFSLSHHGLIGSLMSRAPTLHQALLDFVTWQAGYSSGAIVYLNRMGEDLALGYGTLDQVSAGTAQLYDGAVAVGIRMIQELTAGRAAPLEVHFSRRQPANHAVYARLFKLPVRFNQQQTCLILDNPTAGTRLPNADADLHQQALATIEHAVKERLAGHANRVRHVLRPMLYSGDVSMRTAAAKLGLHPRTLRRRLNEEGRTFEALRDEMRFTLARELLEMTDLRVSEIGHVLALASPGTFAESFSRWSGMTPTRWRQNAAARSAVPAVITAPAAGDPLTPPR